MFVFKKEDFKKIIAAHLNISISEVTEDILKQYGEEIDNVNHHEEKELKKE